MKYIKYVQLTILLVVVLLAFRDANAQYAYALSDIVYDKTTKKVTSFSGTALDFWAGLHYDPAVVGGMFQTGNLLGYASRTGYADIFDAIVKLRTVSPAPPNTQYDVLSDHYIKAYFYTDVIIIDDDPPQRQWYDPLGFSRFGGGSNLGSYSYKGAAYRAAFYESQYFYLGTTGKGVISDPPPCQGVALVGEECPDDLTVQIRNQFKGTQDLSSTQQRALLGAPVELTSNVTSSSTEPKTFKWKINGVLNETADKYYTYFDKLGPHTVTLEVQQGLRTVSKSFQIDVSIPQLVPGQPNITGGFSAIERLPTITTPANRCGLDLPPILRLGCPTRFPPVDRSSVDTAGLFAQGIVAPIDDFISNGDQSYVEFLQIIKPSIIRYGKDVNGKEFAECLKFTTTDTAGWRKDFSGQDEETGELAGFRYSTTFRNDRTGVNARVKLDFIDSPAVSLQDRSGNNEVINSYSLDQQFETYITYYADSITGVPGPIPQGQEFRHALAVIPWSWNARAKRNGSTWSFSGTPFPTTVINRPSSTLQFAQNSSGERGFSGNYGDTILLDRFMRCSSNPPITTTTKRNVAVWRKTNGIWYVINADQAGTASAPWGEENDIPVPGDYDGDGLADFAVFRPDNPATPEDECLNGCSWYIVRSSDGIIRQSPFGVNGDKPVPADYDGDGQTDLAIFRPGTNEWHLLKSSGAYNAISFGAANDVPVPSDYDGDGIDDIAVWRASNASWYVQKSADQTFSVQQWGASTDKPVIGDYDGDGKTDYAIWRTNGDWHILLSADGQTKTVNLGNPATDIAVPGNYDNDDKTDIAIYRTGVWHIFYSSINQIQLFNWGVEGDIPIPAAYSR